MHTGPFLFPVKKVEMKNAAVCFNNCALYFHGFYACFLKTTVNVVPSPKVLSMLRSAP